MQTELGAPPQHIVGAARPLVGVQVVQFGLEQAGRHLGAERAVAEQPGPRASRSRAPGAGTAARATAGGAAPVACTKRRKSVSGRCALPIQSLRSPPGRNAPRVQAPRGVAWAPARAAHSRSAASSASLRKVVILPPHTDSKGAAAATAFAGVELELVVACHGRRVARFVVEQRAHARIAPHHVRRPHGALEVAARLFAQIVDLAGIDARRADLAVVFHIGGADQRELAFVGNGEDDALVGVLEDVGMVVLEQLLHHHMAALDQAQRLALGRVGLLAEELRRPRPGGIDQRPRRDLVQRRRRHFAAQLPLSVAAPRIDAGAACQHRGAALGGVHRVQHHQPRVVDPAVGIDEALAEATLQRLAGDVLAQVDGGRTRQHLAPRQVVVQEQAGAHHPHRPHARVVRHDEAQRPHDVRRAAQQHLALGQRLAHQRELVVLQVTQPAVDQLGR